MSGSPGEGKKSPDFERSVVIKMEPFILGIDGGGTKTAVCAVDINGRELFRMSGGSLNVNGESAAKVQHTLEALLREATVRAGGNTELAAVGIGAAGISNPHMEPVLRAGAEQAGFRGTLVITGDHMSALAGALGPEGGILVIAGTGSICVGRTQAGREARAGGRGHILDDEGSGYAIGRDILRAVVQAADGRRKCTCLTELAYGRLGISSLEELIQYVYRPDLPKSGIAMLAELLEEGCRQGDGACLEIQESAAEGLVCLATATAAQLGLTGGRLALAGSVLQKNAGIRSAFERRLSKALPGFRTALPEKDAAWGAALLAGEALYRSRMAGNADWLKNLEKWAGCAERETAVRNVAGAAAMEAAVGENAIVGEAERTDAAVFDRQMAVMAADGEACRWHETPGGNIEVRGLGFFAREKRWNRLPGSLSILIKKERPALEQLSRHMAGARLHFLTDSRTVWVRATLDSAPYMSHMAPAAQCGFDCYVRFSRKGPWHYAGISKFPIDSAHICCCLAQDLPGRETEICVNLPLYTGIRSLAIGLDAGARVLPAPEPSFPASIAFYGTSITQGGCAGHSGMAYPAIVGRALDAEVYNMGFSGNGVGTPGLAPALCTLPGLGALVVDMEANAGPEGVLEENLRLFMDAVRKETPTLPVLVLSGTRRPGQAWDNGLDRQREAWINQQEKEVKRRISEGDRRIFFADASRLLGEAGGEATMDGVHLNDLGFWLLAEKLTPILREIVSLN